MKKTTETENCSNCKHWVNLNNWPRGDCKKLWEHLDCFVDCDSTSDDAIYVIETGKDFCCTLWEEEEKQ